MSGLPVGWGNVAVGASRGTSLGRRWRAVRTVHAGGRSEKIEAWALDGHPGEGSVGSGYVSANLYRLGSGPRLLPCEMPAARVLRFVADWRPDPPPPSPCHGSDAESPA